MQNAAVLPVPFFALARMSRLRHRARVSDAHYGTAGSRERSASDGAGCTPSERDGDALLLNRRRPLEALLVDAGQQLALEEVVLKLVALCGRHVLAAGRGAGARTSQRTSARSCRTPRERSRLRAVALVLGGQVQALLPVVAAAQTRRVRAGESKRTQALGFRQPTLAARAPGRRLRLQVAAALLRVLRRRRGVHGALRRRRGAQTPDRLHSGARQCRRSRRGRRAVPRAAREASPTRSGGRRRSHGAAERGLVTDLQTERISAADCRVVRENRLC